MDDYIELCLVVVFTQRRMSLVFSGVEMKMRDHQIHLSS